MSAFDIEDDDIGFYGSYVEYATPFIQTIATCVSRKPKRGELDTHQFIAAP